MKFAILFGNPVQGFEAVGPFNGRDEAISWGVNNIMSTDSWCEIELMSPEAFTETEDEDVSSLIATVKDREEKQKLEKNVMLDLSGIAGD